MEFLPRELELLVQSVHNEAHTATDAGDISRLMQLTILLERLRKEHTKQNKIDEREHEIMLAHAHRMNQAADIAINAIVEQAQAIKGKRKGKRELTGTGKPGDPIRPAALNRPHDAFWWDIVHGNTPKTRTQGPDTSGFDDPNDPIFGWNDNPDNKGAK